MADREAQTDAIVLDALRSGKQVFVPFTHKLRRAPAAEPSALMDMVALHSEADYQALGKDRWGIPTPGRDSVGGRANCFGGMGLCDREAGDAVARGCEAAGLDLIVVPGVAFDREMRRLGHGKGYYDSFFSRYEAWCRGQRGRMPALGAFSLVCAKWCVVC